MARTAIEFGGHPLVVVPFANVTLSVFRENYGFIPPPHPAMSSKRLFGSVEWNMSAFRAAFDRRRHLADASICGAHSFRGKVIDMEKRSHDDVSDSGRDPKRRRRSMGEASVLSDRPGNEDVAEPNSPSESEIPTVPNTPTRSLTSSVHADRTSNPKANLSGLAEELRAKIFSYLTDPENLDTTLNAAAPWLFTSKALKATAVSRLDDEAIQKVFAAQDMRSGYFTGFAYEQPDNDYAAVLLLALEINTGAAPLMDAGKRRTLVRDAVSYGARRGEYADTRDVYHVFDNIAANLDNFIGPDRVKVVNRVCDIHEASQGYGGVMEKLIDKSDHLESKERLTLVNTVCRPLIDIDQTSTLSAWAPKMYLLDDIDQAAIFEQALRNPGDRPELLAYFAKHADRACSSVRRDIATSVLDTEPQGRLRSKMLCHLAEHLESFDVSIRSDVIEAVIANVQHAKTEEFDPNMDDYYDEPNFCAREALFHLYKPQTPLSSLDRERIAAAIDAVMATSGTAGRMQFLATMSLAEQTIAVRQACKEASEQGEFASMPVLGGRMGALTKEETAHFVDTLLTLPIEDRRIRETIEHIVRNELKHLDASQRSLIVRRRLEIMPANDVSEAASGLADIRRNATLLHEQDITAMTKTARHVFNLFAPDPPQSIEAEISLRSCHREAVRCLWEWAGHAVLHPRSRAIAVGR